MSDAIHRNVNQLVLGALLALAVALSAGETQGAETSAKPEEGESTARNAPAAEKPAFHRIGSLYLIAGAAFFDYDQLNSSLGAEGYSELENPSFAIGFGGDLRWKRIIFGGEGIWLLNVHGESDQPDLKSNISAWYALFRAGYVVFERAGFSIYPLFGIGGGQINLDVATIGGASFDDVLADPAREVRMEQSGLLLDASLGVDYRMKIQEKNDYKSFFLVGLRGGYLFAPYNQGWDAVSGEISGGPDFGLTGANVQLVLGFSAERTGRRHHGCRQGCPHHPK